MSKREIPEGLTPEEEKKWIKARIAAYTKKNDAKIDKMTVRLPAGTADRIRALGQVPATFIKEITLDKLDEIEKYKG